MQLIKKKWSLISAHSIQEILKCSQRFIVISTFFEETNIWKMPFQNINLLKASASHQIGKDSLLTKAKFSETHHRVKVISCRRPNCVLCTHLQGQNYTSRNGQIIHFKEIISCGVNMSFTSWYATAVKRNT